MISAENLIWIDLEMTGLNPKFERIIEMATIVTDSDLNVLSEGPVFAINQPTELLDNMDKWNTRQHNASGLVNRVINSPITESQAEDETLAFLKRWVPANASPMCGNSIGQDRRFLNKYMPKLESHFHYRNLDVSTLKILARWSPRVSNAFKKNQLTWHFKTPDSIAELNITEITLSEFRAATAIIDIEKGLCIITSSKFRKLTWILSQSFLVMLSAHYRRLFYQRSRVCLTRQSGSGNAGATNMLRTNGLNSASQVLIVDLVKGLVAVLIGRLLGCSDGGLVSLC